MRSILRRSRDQRRSLQRPPAVLPLQALRCGTLPIALLQCVMLTDTLLREVFDASPDAILVTDDGGVIRDVNECAASMFQWDRGELVGQSVDLLVPFQHRARHAELRAKYALQPRARPMGQWGPDPNQTRPRGDLEPIMAAGAMGFIRKSRGPDDLVRAVDLIAAGRTTMPRVASQLYMRRRREFDTQPESPLAALNNQEREILRLTARGYTASQIAGKMSLARKTIENYRARLKEKLGLRDRSDWVDLALKSRLLLDE